MYLKRQSHWLKQMVLDEFQDHEIHLFYFDGLLSGAVGKDEISNRLPMKVKTVATIPRRMPEPTNVIAPLSVQNM